TIISSQAEHTMQDMDSVWSQVILRMGHTPTIVPQSTLDNEMFFSGTDILIVSNAVIGLTTLEVNTILQFVKSGKPVYLQSEYLPNYTTNQAFTFIINSLDGSFTWNNVFSDFLDRNVIGTYRYTNNIVNTVRFWYSVSGTGDCNTINFLEYGGAYHVFQYIPTNPSYGSIITTADQDWILSRLSLQLMENIIT